MNKFLLLLATAIIFTSCLKTSAEIKRDKKVDQLFVQAVDMQNLLADLTIASKNLQEKIARIDGSLEEIDHKSKEKEANLTKTTNEMILQLSSQIEELQKQVKSLQAEILEHRKFIDKITKTITKPSQTQPEKTQKKSNLEEATALFKKHQYKKSKEILLTLVDDKKISQNQLAEVLTMLGRISVTENNNQDALIYFGKVYSQHPNSKKVPEALYYIGITLQKMGNKDQAKESFNKIISTFPKSSFATKASEELKK